MCIVTQCFGASILIKLNVSTRFVIFILLTKYLILSNYGLLC